ncbi:tetratricopeptide repeat protein [Sphingomicrobium clamense]|uniref:Tetratricopeptide repeat protein n=1 Tax=Sphingomicrobium clamense TaxID=2851013 RepID=A0ABS6V6B4_9SPHN|nr:tetratricopeptide repeat protein [Sphingomicrobium sp. B8]MBW0145109.1 tetratricopeptide repeat protein [Sphingomicrobium sp. B8]
MKLPMTAIALGLAAMGMTTPAAAVTTAVAQDEEQKAPELSKKGQEALAALQAAIQEERWADVPALVATAESDTETNDGKIILQKLRLNAAINMEDYEAAIDPIDKLAAMGAMEPQFNQVYVEVGKRRLFDENYDGAADVLQKALNTDPNNAEALIALAEVRTEQGQVDEGIKLLTDAIAQAEAAGGAEESWYKRAVKLAYDNENPAVFGLTRNWVTNYPSASNWRDTLRIYMGFNDADPAKVLDIMRLQFAAGALESEGDYLLYAEELLRAGFPGEAMAVINAGKQANAFDMNKRIVTEIISMAENQAKGDRESLDADFQGALSGSEPKKTITLADAYYGYGEYQKAAELYRAALGKSGVQANLANLRLGMTLARSGDYAAAKEVLSQVSGAQADAAAYWLAWVETQM